MSDIVNVILNGKPVKGTKGETVLELAHRHGIEIPTLCNDPRLEPYSSCYICVVQVEGIRGLQPSCSTRINEGMRVETHNSKIFQARKMALDLLLSNHYADCLGPCKQTCPAGVDVQGYISLIEKGMYSEAIAVIKETNPLPAVCGRVCVRPCEVACRRNLLDEGSAVGIDYLKRFAADTDLASETKYVPKIKQLSGKKVGIIGAGPAGLSTAFFLRKEGHNVDIYEASPLAGGWLRYGIPEYRLPNDILQREVDNITDLGVNILYNHKLGVDISYQALKFKYDAIVLAIGSQLGTRIGCDGDDAENVFSGIDFLKQMEISGERYDFSGKTVAVIGGGNTAMDCCRTSMRCGAQKVYVIYRRTENEMPANPIEIHESKIEGVDYHLLTAPIRVNKDAEGKVKSITCLKMELGEPDSSGRRRPLPVDGSEYDIEINYILAAIGQKTIVNFVDDVNRHTDFGELKINKWGDLDTDPQTLQSGVKRIFAAGDGVTGPATLIQAVGQARVAARSVHQFLMGLPIVPEKKEFLSRKENFRVQTKEEYLPKFEKQIREEMPVLPAENRYNFKEVELGYDSDQVALHETSRCLECGCTEYNTCDLKRYSTEYEADQVRIAGEFKDYQVDFRHPFVEIDNNKCILCARCVRICREVVGANALGLVNRGFDTFVAPSMGDSLTETDCESCGLCISTCPTGAITENVLFKPGPVKMQESPVICNYCSVGCSMTIHHRDGFAMKVTGNHGKVNSGSNICQYGKFGYHYINDKNRITHPLMKVGDHFEEISYEEAYSVIAYKMRSVLSDENAFYAGARLTNEELYLVQKLARAGARTNNITSFQYVGRGKGYFTSSAFHVHLHQIGQASRLFILGADLSKDNAVAGYKVNKARVINKVPVEYVTIHEKTGMDKKVDSKTVIKDYFSFVRALNHYLLAYGLENQLYITDNCIGFDEYRQKLLVEDYAELVSKSGSSQEFIEQFAVRFNNEMNAVLIFTEKDQTSHTCYELANLAMLTGKMGKTASGLIALKEKNNSQGMIDMGICPIYGIGSVLSTDKELQQKMREKWGMHQLPETVIDNQKALMQSGKLKNLFIFGEDPVGCAYKPDEIKSWLSQSEFIMVQDYFMTDTAKMANLILPASLPAESGGTYTSTQKYIQKFDPTITPKVEKCSYEQISDILVKFGGAKPEDAVDVLMEAISFLPSERNEIREFVYAESDNPARMFDYGCDYLMKYFNVFFNDKLKK
ncbi:MAG: FAD-dependent oxidoreductase [Bacteroidetes bacterium]|nr:FAD-dependent oxidoreductase [Bacteroidota bacterium]MBU1718442.1 FAD-dependent oxidoreductase [Bacteroidota bacterium]